MFFFEPNGKQEEFIEKFSNLDSQITIFSAANSLGKTSLIVNLLGNLVFKASNRYFKKPLYQDWPFPKRVRYITDPKLTEEIAPFHTEILKWWPRGKYESIKAGHNYFSQYKANGWVIDVMSYDQDPRQFEGATLGLALFDEPPPESLWTPTIRGLRGRGKAGVFMTPLIHAGWFYDKVVPAHSSDIVYGSMEDGCKQHGVRGHLNHEEIKKQVEELLNTRPEEVEARVYGKALYLAGLIYKQFDPDVHVLKEKRIAPANATIYQAVDPHSDKPFACVWAYPESNGDLYIIDEWPNQDFYTMHNCQLTIEDYKRIFEDKEQNMSVYKRIIDRHFADVRSAVNKKTLREELRDDVGLYFDPSYKAEEEIDTGILAVRSYLKFDSSRPVTSLNRPKLYVNPHCLNTIKSFMRWSRNPENGKVKEEYKDFMDCVRMLVMENPAIDVPLPDTPIKKLWG